MNRQVVFAEQRFPKSPNPLIGVSTPPWLSLRTVL